MIYYQKKKKKNVLKTISFHLSCKCGCLLEENVCNNKQKWNKEKCRYECLREKKCSNDSFFNVINCRCEIKKMAALIKTEECDIETDEIKSVSENKTITLIKREKIVSHL